MKNILMKMIRNCPIFVFFIPNLCLAWCFWCLPAPQPHPASLYDEYRWSLLSYYGFTVNNALLKVIVFHDLKRWGEEVQSVELAYTLHEENPFRRLVSPLCGIVQLAGNVTAREGHLKHPRYRERTVFEFDPGIMFRWANWPWNHYVETSLALTEGISYASSIPAIEKKDESSRHHKRLLNYLMLEATFSAPFDPRLQLVLRIHHRSGAYGLYRAGNTGSNDLGLGVRYLF